MVTGKRAKFTPREYFRICAMLADSGMEHPPYTKIAKSLGRQVSVVKRFIDKVIRPEIETLANADADKLAGQQLNEIRQMMTFCKQKARHEDSLEDVAEAISKISDRKIQAQLINRIGDGRNATNWVGAWNNLMGLQIKITGTAANEREVKKEEMRVAGQSSVQILQTIMERVATTLGTNGEKISEEKTRTVTHGITQENAGDDNKLLTGRVIEVTAEEAGGSVEGSSEGPADGVLSPNA